jgi:hypothetical protein
LPLPIGNRGSIHPSCRSEGLPAGRGVLFIDGKSFAEDEMIMGLGVPIDGEKVVLGFVQSGTENERVVKGFLNSLID